jgi:hypothetical protein
MDGITPGALIVSGVSKISKFPATGIIIANGTHPALLSLLSLYIKAWEAFRAMTQDNLSRRMLQSFSSSTRGSERHMGLRPVAHPALPSEPRFGNTVWLGQ